MGYNISWIWIFVLISSCTIDITGQTPESVEYEEISFKDGKGYYDNKLYTGLVTARHANGKKKFESDFVKGIDDGRFREWDTEGNLLEESTSKDGKLHGKFVRYYPSGQKHFETMYDMGVPEGEALEWHENGQIKIKYYFNRGKENGPYTLWNSEGRKILEGQMRNGQRHGEWYEYNENQNKVIINIYNQGELIKSKPQS